MTADSKPSPGSRHGFLGLCAILLALCGVGFLVLGLLQDMEPDSGRDRAMGFFLLACLSIAGARFLQVRRRQLAQAERDPQDQPRAGDR